MLWNAFTRTLSTCSAECIWRCKLHLSFQWHSDISKDCYGSRCDDLFHSFLWPLFSRFIILLRSSFVLSFFCSILWNVWSRRRISISVVDPTTFYRWGGSESLSLWVQSLSRLCFSCTPIESSQLWKGSFRSSGYSFHDSDWCVGYSSCPWLRWCLHWCCTKAQVLNNTILSLVRCPTSISMKMWVFLRQQFVC